MKQKPTKSPLKGRPLRNPGQGIEEQIEKVINQQAMPWVTMAVFMLVLVGLEWLRWATGHIGVSGVVC